MLNIQRGELDPIRQFPLPEVSRLNEAVVLLDNAIFKPEDDQLSFTFNTNSFFFDSYGKVLQISLNNKEKVLVSKNLTLNNYGTQSVSGTLNITEVYS